MGIKIFIIASRYLVIVFRFAIDHVRDRVVLKLVFHNLEVFVAEIAVGASWELFPKQNHFRNAFLITVLLGSNSTVFT